MSVTPIGTGLADNAKKFVDGFEASSNQRMAEENESNEPIEPLYHYTSEEAFYSIIRSGVFRFSSIYTMDDTEELTYGWGVAQSKMQDALATDDPVERIFLEELVNDEDIEKIKKRIEVYSISFGERDIPGQWERYGNDRHNSPHRVRALLLARCAPDGLRLLFQIQRSPLGDLDPLSNVLVARR